MPSQSPKPALQALTAHAEEAHFTVATDGPSVDAQVVPQAPQSAGEASQHLQAGGMEL